MNDAQRQILADRINFLSRDIDAREDNIAEREAALDRAKARLAASKKELAALKEGVDW